MHFGTPCTTYSRARKLDGKGPPPLRSLEHLSGLPGLKPWGQKRVDEGSLFMRLSCKIARAAHKVGCFFSIENPASSMIWSEPDMRALTAETQATAVVLDSCAFGTPWKKPTTFLVNDSRFSALGRRCPGCAQHDQLEGETTDEETGGRMWRTRKAQVYPRNLCLAYAAAVALIRGGEAARAADPWAPLQATLAITTPPAERKRPLGSSVEWRGHRQAFSALRAAGGGYQMKKGALPPLFSTEIEPGRTVQIALSCAHPLALGIPAGPLMQPILDILGLNKPLLLQQRAAAATKWGARARDLRARAVELIRQHPDRHLRKLYGHGVDPLPASAEVGTFVHFPLWYELAHAVGTLDTTFV